MVIIGIIPVIIGLIIGVIGNTIVEENTWSWGKYYSTGMKESNEEMIMVGQITVWTGICLFFIGLILAIIGYILKEKIQPQSQHLPKFCVNCGRSITFDAQVCPYCGKRL